MKIPELLAPAGSKAALNAAVRAGANAVYLGLDDFNARRSAENFTVETLRDVCDYCHLRGTKVYVTINTLIITKELKRLLSMVGGAVAAGADAFIIQDPGIAKAISEAYGPKYVHISTQMNIHNLAGVESCAALGAGRITLARELSLGEIELICARAHELGMEIECFAHGAICVCYSGQCLMSSMIGARSANRGMCAQACRLPYELISGEKKNSSGEKCHLLSPKDMCTIDNLEDFAKAGVDSLKVEGRMKSPEYVSSVIGVYRGVLDRLPSIASADEMQVLESSFSRGFTYGYLVGERGNDLMSYNRPNNRGLNVGRVKSIRGGKHLEISTEVELAPCDSIAIWTKHGTTILDVPENAEISKSKCKFEANKDCKDISPKDRVFRVRSARDAFVEDEHEPRLPLKAHLKMKIGRPFECEVSSLGQAVKVLGAEIEAARTKAVSKDEVIEHFDRLGSTDFVLEAIDVELDEGVGIGFSAIHKLRAEAIEKLRDAIVKRDLSHAVAIKPEPASSSNDRDERPIISVICTNAAMARAASRAGCEVYVPLTNFKRGFATSCGVVMDEATQASYPNDAKIMLPIVQQEKAGDSREAKLGFGYGEGETFDFGARVLYCDDLASFMVARAEGREAELGQFVPLTNDLSINLANQLGPSVVWLSPELNLAQIKDIAPKFAGADVEIGRAHV